MTRNAALLNENDLGGYGALKKVLFIFPLVMLLLVAGCDVAREASCQKTTMSFVDHFNRQDFRGVVSLFPPRALDGQQIKRLNNNLRYSGYSSEPHLHFIVQNVADLFHPTGANCYFDSIRVNGVLKQGYLPVQGELVSNY